jgi:hypothetical protein
MLLAVICRLVTAKNTSGSNKRINYYRFIRCIFDVTGNGNKELSLGYYDASVNVWIQKTTFWDGFLYLMFLFETEC